LAEIIGTSGSLKELIRNLNRDRIYDYNTLDDLLAFQKNWKKDIEHNREQAVEELQLEISKIKAEHNLYESKYQEMVQVRTKMLYKERGDLPNQIQKYSVKTKNPFKFLFNKSKYLQLNNKLKTLTNNFEKEVIKPFRKLIKTIKNLDNSANYREHNFDFIVNERCKHYENKMTFIDFIIKHNKLLLIGAIGENKTIDELSKLPDSFIVLNDVQLGFDPPIYNRKEDDHIFSIQIDHLVIGPSGVFNIETKNWSEESIKNLDLFSPVKQIKRANYALFTIINSAILNRYIRVKNHHWGDKKISVRNILLMVSAKPKEEFQFVKILSLSQITGYLTYFEEILSQSEIRTIANFIQKY
jgi:hypothetical protein